MNCKGHKCHPAQIFVQVSCECGWKSSMWSTKGARAAAYDEWRQHIKECRK